MKRNRSFFQKKFPKEFASASSMPVREIGEKRLIGLLTHGWKGDRRVVRALNEDCAVLRGCSRRQFWLFKTETVVEGVHFVPETPGFLIGRKALARALSDLAAMGGRARYGMVALAVPPDFPFFTLSRLYEGIERLAGAYGLYLLGGETVRCDRLVVTVSLWGETRGYRPLLRKGARPGDLLYVTGELGGSFPAKHLLFEPRLREGEWLARNRIARAMTDVSDGLAADLPRLAEASGVSFELDLDKIPLRAGVPLGRGLQEGEDYELLFAVSRSRAKELQKRWPFRTKLTCIGQCQNRAEPKAPTGMEGLHGFDHFAQP
jgi:thiamine-monophosphate kinase